MNITHYMTKVPCEQYVWNVIPAIRSELAICLVEVFELTQQETAKKLGLTPPAVCQYLSGKRGNGTIHQSLHYEVLASAERIIKDGESVAQQEICRLCHLVQKKM